MTLKNNSKGLKISEQTISTLLGALVVIIIGFIIFNNLRTNINKVSEPQPKKEDVSQEVKLKEENGKLVPEGLPTKHTVKKGEDLWKIAIQYYGSGYNWVDISKENKLSNPNVLTEGQELNIPQTPVINVAGKNIAQNQDNKISGDTYTIQKGDSLWKIAVRAYADGYKWVEIAKVNEIKNPSLIHAGNQIKLSR